MVPWTLIVAEVMPSQRKHAVTQHRGFVGPGSDHPLNESREQLLCFLFDG